MRTTHRKYISSVFDIKIDIECCFFFFVYFALHIDTEILLYMNCFKQTQGCSKVFNYPHCNKTINVI